MRVSCLEKLIHPLCAPERTIHDGYSYKTLKELS